MIAQGRKMYLIEGFMSFMDAKVARCSWELKLHIHSLVLQGWLVFPNIVPRRATDVNPWFPGFVLLIRVYNNVSTYTK